MYGNDTANGGSSESETDDNNNSNFDQIFNGLGDFFASIIDWLSSIAKSISEIPSRIGEFLENLGTSLLNGLEKLGNTILDGIKRIFIPDMEVINSKIDYLKNRFMVAFGISDYDVSFMFISEKALGDITINILGTNVTIVSMKFVIEALATFRPILRGFLALLLIYYHIDQFLNFIGQSSSARGGHIPIEQKQGLLEDKGGK